MTNPYSWSAETADNLKKNPHRNKSEAAIGLDMDEQAMNGLYGMPETEAEDRRDDNHERPTQQ